MHVTMRAECATGGLSLLVRKHAQFIRAMVKYQSRKWHVRVYEWSNNENHLHLLVQAKTRLGFQNFLRSLAGIIGLKITGASRGNPFGKRFWDLLAFSRVVEWGRAMVTVRNYIIQNQLEAAGLIPYRPRKTRYASPEGLGGKMAKVH